MTVMDGVERAELFALVLFAVAFVCLCILRAKVDRLERMLSSAQKAVIILQDREIKRGAP